MKKNLLLPYSFKKIGWAILIPALILGILTLVSDLDGLPDKFLKSCEFLHSSSANRTVNNIAIIGIILGSVLASCSKEKVEDEMISAVRMNSLLLTLYIDFGLLIISSLFIYDFEYFYVMAVNLCMLPVLFLILWNVNKYKMRRGLNYEK